VDSLAVNRNSGEAEPASPELFVPALELLSVEE